MLKERLNQDQYLAIEERENGTLYRGFTGHNESLINHYLSYGNFKEMPEYADGGFRRVYIDSENKTTFTYCEGDIYFKVCNNWNKELEEMKRFYSEY